jgi:hypothetical protein
LQALFLMNGKFVVDQARSLVNRPDVATVPGITQRIRRLYQLLFARLPDPEEIELGMRFLVEARDDGKEAGGAAGVAHTKMTAWEKYAQVLLLADEFVFID